jgi:pimeloyl-ACP methyl ester carboxylesterase
MMQNTTRDNSLTLVLLHGAGLGAWIWDDVIANLDYSALAVDFPGRGSHVGIPTRDLLLTDYIESLLSDIEQFAPDKVIIVAHSLSGVLGIELVRLLGDRVVGFVGSNASLVKTVYIQPGIAVRPIKLRSYTPVQHSLTKQV